MRRFTLIAALLVLTVVFSVKDVFAGAPFVNLEGVGGVAFNPLAYPADSEGENSHFKIGDSDIIGSPRFGGWYVNLDRVNVDWIAIGVADTFLRGWRFPTDMKASTRRIRLRNIKTISALSCCSCRKILSIRNFCRHCR